MLIAFVLVCAIANNHCTLDNAIDVLRVPGTFNLPMACFQSATEYSAQVDYPITAEQKFVYACIKEDRDVG